MTQLINLTENELDIYKQIFLDMIFECIENFIAYQATIEVAKVSKLLLLMEGGKIDKTTISSLDDIYVEEDIVQGMK